MGACRFFLLRVCIMRFLMLRAYDISDNARPDVVYLDFYDDTLAQPLAMAAAAVDMKGDGRLDWKLADDINHNGVTDTLDAAMALEFAQQFLEFNWFSQDGAADKYLMVFAVDFDANGIPDTVRLHFHQGEGQLDDESLAYTAAYFTNEVGTADGAHISQDVNNDGRVNGVDAELVRRFSSNFLLFGWHDARRPTPSTPPCKPVLNRP